MSCLGFFNQRIQPCGVFWVHVKLIAGFIHIFFFGAPCGMGVPSSGHWYPAFFSPYFFWGGNGTTLQWSNMATNKHPLIAEFPRTPSFFEDFRLLSQKLVSFLHPGIQKSGGNRSPTGYPYSECSLLNVEKKELPTTCALMCHGEMVKIWIFSPWALVWWATRGITILCWFSTAVLILMHQSWFFWDRFWPQVSTNQLDEPQETWKQRWALGPTDLAFRSSRWVGDHAGRRHGGHS